MEYYQENGRYYVSHLPNLPLSHAAPPSEDIPLTYLFARRPDVGRVAFCVSGAGQLSAGSESVAFFDPRRLGAGPALSPELGRRIDQRMLMAANVRHPHFERAVALPAATQKRRRIHLLAVGDVGATLLMGLKLLGSDCISTIGICDLNENAVERWVAEMGQVSWPWDYDALPHVEAVAPDQLFDCDVFVFAATKAIPPADSGIQDVRMAQLKANRLIVSHYAQLARKARFGGLFIVLSDPVDPLCKAAFLASNAGADGQWDGEGLLPDQIQGFGLGVMNARAAALARQNPAYQSFLDEGRSFGPHGQGLIIANSIQDYDDALSQKLTGEVLKANLRIRELGFKPYAAPALSSGCMQLLLTLRGKWHCSSVCLGDVWFGCRNRWTPLGVETEALALPDTLFARLTQTEAALREIL